VGLAWVYLLVVRRSAWPSVACTKWTGAPRSRAWLAWAWRSQWGLTSPAMPARFAAAAAPWATTISAMASAFLAGDNADGEELLLAALDLGAPWDVATTAAARALVEHRARVSAPGTTDGLFSGPAAVTG